MSGHYCSNIVAISIIRAGDSMLDSFLTIVPEAVTGKILIQRNEETAGTRARQHNNVYRN